MRNIDALFPWDRRNVHVHIQRQQPAWPAHRKRPSRPDTSGLDFLRFVRWSLRNGANNAESAEFTHKQLKRTLCDDSSRAWKQARQWLAKNPEPRVLPETGRTRLVTGSATPAQGQQRAEGLRPARHQRRQGRGAQSGAAGGLIDKTRPVAAHRLSPLECPAPVPCRGAGSKLPDRPERSWPTSWRRHL
jgi:hypothetical protein